LSSFCSHCTWVYLYIYTKARVTIKHNHHLQMFVAGQHRSEILWTSGTSLLHGFACSSQVFPITSFVVGCSRNRPHQD
jgi:hypothetical protein